MKYLTRLSMTTSLLALFAGNVAHAGEVVHFGQFLDEQENSQLRYKFLHDEVRGQRSLSLAKPANQQNEHKAVRFMLKQANISGNTVISSKEMEKFLLPYNDKRITYKDVDNLVRAIEDYYADQGYLLVSVSIDDQNIDDGVLNIKIIEGQIREVIVSPEHQDIKNNPLLKHYLENIVNSVPAKKDSVERALLLIEKIPGYQIEYALQPLENMGNNVADLLLKITKVRGVAAIDASNSGNKDLGKYQVSGLTRINNPLGYNETILASVGTSNHYKALKVANLGYLKRLNSYGTSASVMGSWISDNPFKYAKPNMGSAKDDSSVSIKGALSQYLVLNDRHTVKVEVGAQCRDVKKHMVGQKSVDYNYNLAYLKGKIRHVDFLNAENYLLPSFYSTVNKAKIHLYQQGVYQFDRNFSYFKINWFRDQPLFTSNFSAYTEVKYQHSNAKLPTEEQFFIGSDSVGRGYKTGLINADKGYAADLELRYTHGYKNDKVFESLQPYTFADVAHFGVDKVLTNNQNTLSVFNRKTFYSAGAGLRVLLTHGVRVELEAAVPLNRDIEINNVKFKNKDKYSLMLNKSFEW